MAGSIVMVFLTVPAEVREVALEALASAETGYDDVTATTAFAFIESAGTQLQNRELLLVSARSGQAATATVAEQFWRAVEATLFRDGVSAVEHMIAYAVPSD